MMMNRALSLMFAATLFPAVAMAGDDFANHIHGVRADVHLNAGSYGLLGVGARLDLTLLPHGLIEGVNDEIALSPGLDTFFVQAYHNQYYGGGFYWVPSVVVQWNFYLGDRWSIFPEAGLALYVGDANYLPRGYGVYAAADLGLGARYHFTERNALLMRISTPAGLQLGVTF
jgi:hypothetical protein